MRIISGKYKGRNLLGFDIDGTRPTMERVKESLFSMIQLYLPDSIVLDLFSGSGNLGIEAISEGAKMTYCVDKNPLACKTIEKNLNTIGAKNCKVLKSDYKEALRYFNDIHLKFDVIFLDPPYQSNCVEESIKLISEYKLLNNDGIIVCESNLLDNIIYSNEYSVLKEKKYGNKWIVILKHI